MRRSKYFGVALLGLLVVAAISVAAGSGRKPVTVEQARVSVRMLTDAEVTQVGQRFPELRVQPGGISQVSNELLEHLFPRTSFYKTFDRGGRPPFPYLIAISGDKLLNQPSGFNWLLAERDMEVTDKNIIELAKAFVVLAVGNEPITNPTTGDPDGLDSLPQITFKEATRTKHVINTLSYSAQLKVKVDEQTEVWHFASWQGQLGLVSRGTTDGKLIKQYDLPRAKSSQQRGQLDVTPSIDIVTSSPSKAYVELQVRSVDTVPHYYLIVDTNSVADSFKVRFSLSGFPANATNVYVRVTDFIRNGAVRLLDTVHININGDGYYDWTPPDDSNGICKVEADTLGPDSVYRNATGLPLKELTLERVRDTTFPGSTDETLKVYFCDQFFLGLLAANRTPLISHNVWKMR